MQNYYNNISTAKKVAFIDNISYSEAEVISRRFPFAICLTSRGNEGRTIWYNGEPYGLCKVSSKLITVNNNDEIGLCINSAGEIELYKKVTANVFYIGSPQYNESSISDPKEVSSDYSNLRNTWLKIPDDVNKRNFNNNFDVISNSSIKQRFKLSISDIVIIPNDFNLTLPMFDESTGKNITDDMFNLQSEITINGKQYKQYSINSDYYNSVNGDIYFVSIIEKSE